MSIKDYMNIQSHEYTYLFQLQTKHQNSFKNEVRKEIVRDKDNSDYDEKSH